MKLIKKWNIKRLSVELLFWDISSREAFVVGIKNGLSDLLLEGLDKFCCQSNYTQFYFIRMLKFQWVPRFLLKQGIWALNNSYIVISVKREGKSNFQKIFCDEVLLKQYNILYIHTLKHNDLSHANNVIFTYFIFWLINGFKLWM